MSRDRILGNWDFLFILMRELEFMQNMEIGCKVTIMSLFNFIITVLLAKQIGPVVDRNNEFSLFEELVGENNSVRLFIQIS